MADDQLKKLLTEAKQKPRNFVLAVNGQDVGIILSKKKISPAQIKEAKSRAKNATKFVTGIVEAGVSGFTFKSTEPIPSSAMGPLKKHVADEAGITLKANFEQVASLVEVDEKDDRFADVTGGKSGVDVKARQTTELNSTAQKLRDFVRDADQMKIEYQRIFTEADTRWKALRADETKAKKDLALAQKQTPIVQDQINALTKTVNELPDLINQAFELRTKAQTNVKDLPNVLKGYIDSLNEFDRLDPVADFNQRYELMQHGRIAAMENVRKKLNEVYEATNKKLVILGRTHDTFEKDDSWVAKHPTEGGRVLQEGDWSMAVNDEFINSGLDQKAEFAMISKFKEVVLKQIKKLLQNPEGRTKEQIKTEIRQFAKDNADPALYSGGRYNDGFTVSMLELEQLIDDGYVMMEHDNDASTVKDLKDLKPTPTMVPSGQGQKIKEELGKAVEAREKKIALLRKKVNDEFAVMLKDSKTKIADSKEAKESLRSLKMAMDENRWEDAAKFIVQMKRQLA